MTFSQFPCQLFWTESPTAVSSAQLVDLRPGLSLAHTHTYEHHDETNDCENYEYMSNHLLP